MLINKNIIEILVKIDSNISKNEIAKQILKKMLIIWNQRKAITYSKFAIEWFENKKPQEQINYILDVIDNNLIKMNDSHYYPIINKYKDNFDQMDILYQQYKKLNTFTNSLQNLFKNYIDLRNSFPKNEISRRDEFFNIQDDLGSTLIENIQINENLFTEKNDKYSKNYDEVEKQTIQNNDFMMDEITLKDIKNIHKILFNLLDFESYSSSENTLGEFRDKRAYIKGYGYLPSEVEVIDELMNKWIKEFNVPRIDFAEIIYYSGVLHAEFERIHPFSDGDGRTGRYLIKIYLLKNLKVNIPYSKLINLNKKEYLDMLNSINDSFGIEETNPFSEIINFWFKITIKFLNNEIEEFKQVQKEILKREKEK